MAAPIWNKRMLEIMESMVGHGRTFEAEKDFWQAIKFSNVYRIDAVRNGSLSFKPYHIQKALQLSGRSADWLFGFSNEPFREDSTKSALDKLKEVVTELESQEKVKLKVVAKKRKAG